MNLRILAAYTVLGFALGCLAHLLFPGSHGIIPYLVGLPVGVLGAGHAFDAHQKNKTAPPDTTHENQDP